jgi:hypothetical protein
MTSSPNGAFVSPYVEMVNEGQLRSYDTRRRPAEDHAKTRRASLARTLGSVDLISFMDRWVHVAPRPFQSGAFEEPECPAESSEALGGR